MYVLDSLLNDLFLASVGFDIGCKGALVTWVVVNNRPCSFEFGKAHNCCFICGLQKRFPDVSAHLFEYDQRFEKYGSDFTFYDYNHPDKLPQQHSKAFHLVVADPPYLVWMYFFPQYIQQFPSYISFLLMPNLSFHNQLLLFVDNGKGHAMLLVVPILGQLCLRYFSFVFSFAFLTFIAPIKACNWGLLQCHDAPIVLIKSFQVVIPLFCFSCSGWILQSEECLRKTVESMRYMAADSKEPLYMVLTGSSLFLWSLFILVPIESVGGQVMIPILFWVRQLFNVISPAQNLVRENSHLQYNYLLGAISKC